MGRLHEEWTDNLFFFGGQGCISLGFKIGGILLVIKSEQTIFPALRSVLTVLSCCKDYHCLLTAGLDQEALVWVLKIGPLSFWDAVGSWIERLCTWENPMFGGSRSCNRSRRHTSKSSKHT